MTYNGVTKKTLEAMQELADEWYLEKLMSKDILGCPKAQIHLKKCRDYTLIAIPIDDGVNGCFRFLLFDHHTQKILHSPVVNTRTGEVIS